ncbi:MAG: glycosyltransferase family 9 protein [Cryobacterium sp.]|nr:glycosyltransferase family 9 protein [Oligoflexia bacterium]
MFSPRKILAIKLRALGDTVLMTAPLRELRKAYPDAEIHVVVTEAWAPLLEKQPAVDKVIGYVRHSGAASRAKAIARLAISLRKEHYDTVVNFHASPSSSALAYAVGAKNRSIHFHGHKDKNRYSTVVIEGKGVLKPIIERDMDTVRALGISIPSGRMPSVHLEEEEIVRGKHRIEQMGLYGPVLALGIGASRPTKGWPIDRFAGLAIRWCDEFRGSVIVFHSRTEIAVAREFFAAVDRKLIEWYEDPAARKAVRARILAEVSPPLRLLASLLKCSQLFVGNDSGPKHLAVAVGTKTLTLFGPEDPFEWHPYPQFNHAIHYIEGLPCRNDQDPGFRPWCALNVCVKEEHRCMRGLAEDDVFRTVERMASGNGLHVV